MSIPDVKEGKENKDGVQVEGAEGGEEEVAAKTGAKKKKKKKKKRGKENDNGSADKAGNVSKLYLKNFFT